MARVSKVRTDKVRVGDFYMEHFVNGYGSGAQGEVISVTQTRWNATMKEGLFVIMLKGGLPVDAMGGNLVWVERD